MGQKTIINQLELGYGPLTNYEFSILKKDADIIKSLDQASLYVIAQRPVISFENFSPAKNELILEFEIHQRGNPEVLKCKLPMVQKAFGTTEDDYIYIAINYLDKSEINTKLPFGNMHAFSLVKIVNEQKKFLVWFSPEKLLQNYWRGFIDCEIDGDIRSFLNYKVHYVGKATRQSILKRLSGHNTLQDIVSLESPITYKDLPTQEIAILCFEFKDNLHLQSFGDNGDDVDDMVNAITGKNIPSQEKIFLDAEKALIKAMKPSYNKELFNQYPKSKDGLYNEKYDGINYTLMDPITLKYDQGTIQGGLTLIGGDYITIKNNKIFSLEKVITEHNNGS